jgi:two-component system nitrate/nitrite response regulator NarL
MADLRCLVVDDSSRFLEAARATLEREGVTVVGSASTAAEALAKAERLRPDVILVDVGLGEESGFDLARRLDQQPHSPARVVLISTHASEDFDDLIASSPAAGFLSKSELSGRAIRELLGEHEVRDGVERH